MGPSIIAAAKRLDPREYVLVLTTFAVGAVDVISFVKLGGVFASAMTGNIAFLALYTAAGSLVSAIGSLLALGGFITGVAAGTVLTRERTARNAITILSSTETLLLLAAALLWLAQPHRHGRPFMDLVILILSSSMGLQSIMGKKINLSSIPTVVFTSTLTNIVMAVVDALATRQALSGDSRRQIVSFSVYFTGAFCAGLLCALDLSIVILLPLLAVALALIIHMRSQW